MEQVKWEKGERISTLPIKLLKKEVVVNFEVTLSNTLKVASNTKNMLCIKLVQ